MRNKKIIGLVLLIIGICIVFCFINVISDTNTTTNNSTNSTNTTSTNVTNLTNDSVDVEDNGDVQSSYNQYSSNSNNLKEKVKEDDDEFTAEDAMKDVEENVYFSGFKYDEGVKVKAGYPKVKDDFGCWLVPGYDKKTGEYLGSVYVGQKGGPYFHGPETYHAYKEVVSKNK